MQKISKIFSAISLSVVMTFSSLTAASATPMPAFSAPKVSNVEEVQYRHHRRHYREWRHHRADRYHHRHYHRHHRRSNAGAIIGGLAVGAIIGGALAAPRHSYRGGHAQWCANRYRTYRAYDNTYVPRVGVRAYCRSPYN
ncbi:BA14K family protein [Agrobacterium tumefaciens]|uniref:BA14K family protein n=1 Tax=Agrobacterium tumefaciens TaxID=358 RepID=UPI0029342C98|nr:BA14K family protein [Agrobacterium tumefaciens]